MPVMIPVSKRIFPSFTFTSPCPAKSVIFQPARVFPSNSVFHEAVALGVAAFPGGFVVTFFSSAPVRRPESARRKLNRIAKNWRGGLPAARVGLSSSGRLESRPSSRLRFMGEYHALGLQGRQSEF